MLIPFNILMDLENSVDVIIREARVFKIGVSSFKRIIGRGSQGKPSYYPITRQPVSSSSRVSKCILELYPNPSPIPKPNLKHKQIFSMTC
jgi:hypothetical protein